MIRSDYLLSDGLIISEVPMNRRARTSNLGVSSSLVVVRLTFKPITVNPSTMSSVDDQSIVSLESDRGGAKMTGKRFSV